MPAEQLNEQEIQFKKRARRRLVGAIALVLLMVTVLPMLLDDRSAKAPPQEIAITIPSQEDNDFTSRVAPLNPEGQSPSAADSSTVESESSTAPETAPEPAGDPEAQKPEAAPTAKPAAEKSAPQKPSDRPAADAAGYAVQIGVYSNIESIKPLQQKLLAQGYKSYTENLSTDKGEKIRLRAGPFASRAEAERAMAKIKSAGMTGLVVTR